MLKKLLALTCLTLSINAHAALTSVLGGLAIYDDVADLTWLQDASAAGADCPMAIAAPENFRQASRLSLTTGKNIGEIIYQMVKELY